MVVGAGGVDNFALRTAVSKPSMPGLDERLGCAVVLFVHGARS